MRYLDGKPTDDKRYAYLAQAYVTSINILLVAAFKASLCASLTMAFTQYMWRILRTRPLSISVIESLHGIRSNPFLLAIWQVGRATPLLYVMALLMWLFAIAILFPPSALTVVRHDFLEQIPQVVPNLDVAYGRNIEGVKLVDQTVIPVGNSSFSSWNIGILKTDNVTSMAYLAPNGKIGHLAQVVLASGAVPETQSLCGPNCAYSVKFEGPTFKCTTLIRNETAPYTRGAGFTYYSGWWSALIEPHLMSHFFELNLTRQIGYHDRWLLQEVHFLRCQPAWTEYALEMRYEEGVRAFSYTTSSGRSLDETLVSGSYPRMPEDPNSLDTSIWWRPSYSTSGQWNTESISNLKCMNLYGLLDAIVASLAGTFDQIPTPVDGPNFTATVLGGIQTEWAPVHASFSYWDSAIEVGNGMLNATYWKWGRSKEILPNKTLIRETRFNLNRDNWADTRPSFQVTEGLLNEMVANVTIAAMLTYFPLSVWNQTVLANVTKSRNIYSFSRPMNLILPYTLSLVLSLPFLLIGYVSHRRNGVPALSDSFIQLLVTMVRSKELDRVASLCSSEGGEMATKKLKQTKIMFGAIADANGDGCIRRMGFGLEHEMVRVSK
ncbi:hypothetical protein DE146DRAFT_777376 [Phaeosphaeria sp. MPI-PUGE-AT-0046c]|nr:hypothetical protein DE146DRAFT_777376 [Phaeosphaeria sp. MPI-PUGE-AT-0046c]